MLVAEWTAKDLGLRRRAADLAFGKADGTRRAPAEVAAELGLDEARVALALKMFVKAVPMPADPEPVEVLFEDDAVLVLNKPPRLRSTPRHRHEGQSLLNRAIGHLRGEAEAEPFVVHRLDMETSGVLLFAKSSEMASGIARQFQAKAVQKTYLALVVGVPEPGFEVDAPLAKHPHHETGMAVAASGKPAQTRFRTLAANAEVDLREAFAPGELPDACPAPRPGVSLVEATPLTGRTHQIRVHLAHAGFPIVGDTLYGLVGPWIERHALHARKLALRHPRTGDAAEFGAPLPDDMAALAARAGVAVPAELLLPVGE